MPLDLVSRSAASFAGRSRFGGRVPFALVKGFLSRQQRLTRKLAKSTGYGVIRPGAPVFLKEDQFGQAETQSRILRASSTVS